MDQLKLIWDKIDIKDRFQEAEVNLSHSSTFISSANALGMIRKKVIWKFRYAVFFTISFALALPWISPVTSQGLVAVIIVAYLIGAILLYQETKLLNKEVDHTQNVAAYLEEFHARIVRVIRYEELAVLFLLPVSVSAGMLFGMKLYSPEQEILTLPIQWAIFIGSMIIFTLLGFVLSKKLNQKSFVPFVKELERNIEELKAG